MSDKKRSAKRGRQRQHETTPPADDPPSTTTRIVVLLLLTLLMAAARLHTYDEPVEMDASTYAVIAQGMRSGRDLYTQEWDHKPPAIYVSYALAQSVAGAGPAHVYLLGLWFAVVTLLGVYYAAAPAVGGAAGLYAAAFWSLAATDLHLQANQPNTEVFINACVIWVFALVIRMPADRPALARALSIGALIALASLYKQVAVVAVGLMAAHVVAARFTRHTLIQAATVVIVIAVAWTGVIGYFTATGRYAPFMSAVFEYNRTYAGSIWSNLTAAVQPEWLAPPFTQQLWPLIVLSLIGLGFPRGAISARTRLLLVTFCLVTLVSVALPGRFFRHYYQLWLPFLCVAAACGSAALQRIVNRRWALSAAALTAAAALAILYLQSFTLSADQWSATKYGDRLLLSRRAAHLINRVLLPEERFFQWGHHPELYYYSGRPAVGGEYRVRHLLNGPQPAERTAQLLRDLEAHRPEIVIVVAGHPFPPNHPVPQWIMERYQPLGVPLCDREVPGRFLFLVRRGGRLEAQVTPGSCFGPAPGTDTPPATAVS